MSITPHYIDVTDHISSPQQEIPTLQDSNERHHDRVHHNADLEKGQEDEIIPSDGTSLEGRTIPHQKPRDHEFHKRRHADMAKEPTAAVDPEQGTMSLSHFEESPQTHTFSNFYKRYRIFFHLFIWLVFTGWWIAGLVLHATHDPLSSNTGWLKPFLLWLAITLRIVFFHVPITVITKLIHWVWEETGVRFAELLPDRFKIPLAALLVVSVFLIGGFASPESEDNTRDNRAVSLFGLVVFISVLYATSRNRKAVNWHTVIVGMLVCIVWTTILPLRSDLRRLHQEQRLVQWPLVPHRTSPY